MKNYSIFSKPNACHKFHREEDIIAHNGPAAIHCLEAKVGRIAGFKPEKYRGRIYRWVGFNSSGEWGIVP